MPDEFHFMTDKFHLMTEPTSTASGFGHKVEIGLLVESITYADDSVIK
jgi:hypothetical protein